MIGLEPDGCAKLPFRARLVLLPQAGPQGEMGLRVVGVKLYRLSKGLSLLDPLL